MDPEAPAPISRSLLVAALRQRNFAWLLSGQVIAAFGDRINQAALLSVIIYVTGDTAKYSADIIFWGALPMVALGPFAMALVDRWNRRRTMVASDMGRAVLAALLPLLMWVFPHHYTIYTVVFLIGAFTALFTPCRMAILPSLVEPRLLTPANAIASQAGTVATLVAVPISGWVVENCGRTPSFLVNAVTYLVSAIFILRLRPGAPVRAAAPHSATWEWKHALRDLTDGLLYVGRNREVLVQVIFYGVIQCLVAFFVVSFLKYAVDVLGQTVGGTNLLFGTMGVGMAAGAVWMGCRPQVAEWTFLPMAMLAAAGAGMGLLGWIYSPWMAAPVLAWIGGAAVMVLVPMDTFLQRHVSDEYRGRVFAARGILSGIAFLVSLQFSKGIIYHLGVLQTLRFLGLGAILFGLVTAVMARRCRTRTTSGG